MKILAVRGTNLASIPTFEINLADGPLSQTRIFAITGPTGAGKSTVLDAICLALYDRTPRLLGARDTQTRELEIPGSDPRSIMRRGTVEAQAQVDFASRSGHPFRATWEVWRARKRTDGRIQNQRMRLECLRTGTELSGDTKTQTLELIRKEIGLSFDEFRRAILLAQGDFAAFVDAKPDERAALLEAMTGTELYAQISEAAFLRAKTERESLETLEIREHALDVLDPEAQAKLEAEKAALTDTKKKLHGELEANRKAVFWHDKRRLLQDELQKAVAEERACLEAWQDLQKIRTELDLGLEAQKMRAAAEAETEAKETCQRLAQQEQALEGQVRQQKETNQRAQQEMKKAKKALEALQQEQHHLAPDIERAKSLDLEIENAAKALKKAEEDEQRCQKRHQQLTKKGEQLLHTHQTLEAQVMRLSQEQVRQEGTRPLAEQWPRWQEALRRSTALDAKRIYAQKKADSLRADQRKNDKHRQALEADFKTVDAQGTRMAGEIKQLQNALDDARRQAGPQELRHALACLERARSTIDRMLDLSAEARRLENTEADCKKRRKLEVKMGHQARRELSAAEEQRHKLQTHLDAFGPQFRIDRLQEELIQHRDKLLGPEKPCPLCGSQQHELDQAATSTVKSITRAEPRLEKQQRKLIEYDRQIASLRESVRGYERGATMMHRAQAQTIQRLFRTLAEWNTLREQIQLLWVDSPLLAQKDIATLGCHFPKDPGLVADPKDMKEAKARLARASKTIQDQALASEAVDGALAQKRAALDPIREKAAKLTETMERTQEKATQLEIAIAAQDLESKSAEKQQEHALRNLDTVLEPWPDWRALLQSGALNETLHQAVRAWTTLNQEKKHAEARLQESMTELKLAKPECVRAENDREQAQATRKAVGQEHTRLVQVRAALLGGRSVEDITKDLRHKMEQQKALTESLAEVQSREAQSLCELVAQRQSNTRATQAANARRARCIARTTHELEDTQIQDRTQLHALLERGAPWFETQRSVVQNTRSALERARATAQDRKDRLEQHHTSGAPGQDAKQSCQALHTNEKWLTRTIAKIAQLDEKLRANAMRREKRAKLEPQIAAQKAMVALSSELNTLIGARDGKKFRTFAQSLTLDALLEQANNHLNELRPRYKLERVLSHDMELQVLDRDMGNEVRSLSTLSGGERFLVSLALALGLSSLSSSNIRIESLFIDEGFGSLDPHSLELAIAALDQLQAGGRTVGLISHVPELAERIGYQIRVEPIKPGKSQVHVVS